jgi:hypothetical protein
MVKARITNNFNIRHWLCRPAIGGLGLASLGHFVYEPERFASPVRSPPLGCGGLRWLWVRLFADSFLRFFTSSQNISPNH